MACTSGYILPDPGQLTKMVAAGADETLVTCLFTERLTLTVAPSDLTASAGATAISPGAL